MAEPAVQQDHVACLGVGKMKLPICRTCITHADDTVGKVAPLWVPTGTLCRFCQKEIVHGS